MRAGLTPQQTWWFRYAGITGPGSPADAGASAAPFPQSPLPVAVDLFMFGNWVEVTRLSTGQAGVYSRDSVTITRGKSSEGNTVDPTIIGFTLNNRDGRFSPRNPVGPYYGQIGRNTQARVRVGSDVRAVGEVPSWPAKWTPDGQDVWVPVQAAGIFRRLQQGASPLRSAMYRWVTSATALLLDLTGPAAAPVAYWPCEDADGATQLASGTGGPAMAIAGTPTLASNSDIAASDNLPLLSNSTWTGTVPTYTGTGTIQVDILLSIPAGGTTNGAVLLRLRCTGTAPRWDLQYNTGGTVTVLAYDPSGTLLLTSGAVPTGLDGVPTLLGFYLVTAGADVSWNVSHEPIGPASGGTSSGTLAGVTISQATTVQVAATANIDAAAAGHVSVWSQTVFDEGRFLDAYNGETAGTRIARLCAEEGITYLRVLPSHTSTTMGPQRPGKLVDLLRECETADQGVLFEPRTFLGLAYVDRQGLYNQAPAVTLDYAAGDLSQFEPTDDDLLVRNDVTASRPGGSTSQQRLETGTLSVLPPPAGVGLYDTTVTVNVPGDTDLPNQASWRLHLGTVDEPRYPQIGVNLARSNFAGSPALSDAAAALDVGQLLAVTSPPAWLPPGEVDQIAIGFVETLAQFTRTITVNCVPASPYTVGVYDDPAYRYSSDGSTLAADAGPGVTTLTVATPTGPLWSTTAAAFDLIISGEQVTATTVSGSSSPQTFTVTRSVNGVTKTLPAGSVVALAQPTTAAL